MIKFSLTRDQDFVLYIAPCGTADWKNQMCMATEDDLRSAGYVKSSPGFTSEHRLDNQAIAMRDLCIERDNLKRLVDGLRFDVSGYRTLAERDGLKLDQIMAIIRGEI